MISVERCESGLNTKSEKNPNKNEETMIKDKLCPKEGKIEFINFLQNIDLYTFNIKKYEFKN